MINHFKGNLLLIDDEEELSMSMKELFEEEAKNIYIASNGEEALSILEKNNIHCVVSDIKMPVMDGLSATKAIRKCNEKLRVPIIAVTAFGKQFYEQAIEAGCNDLITKPVDFDTLQPMLEQYLAQ